MIRRRADRSLNCRRRCLCHDAVLLPGSCFRFRQGTLTTGASKARRNAAAGPNGLFYPHSSLRNFPLDLPVAGRFI